VSPGPGTSVQLRDLRRAGAGIGALAAATGGALREFVEDL
jgi:hypothetical protein